MESGLRKFYLTGNAPRQAECLEVIHQHPGLFDGRTWKDMKTYVYNAIKSKKLKTQ